MVRPPHTKPKMITLITCDSFRGSDDALRLELERLSIFPNTVCLGPHIYRASCSFSEPFTLAMPEISWRVLSSCIFSRVLYDLVSGDRLR